MKREKKKKGRKTRNALKSVLMLSGDDDGCSDHHWIGSVKRYINIMRRETFVALRFGSNDV